MVVKKTKNMNGKENSPNILKNLTILIKSLDFSVLDFTSECFIYREPLLTMIKEKVLYYISAMMIS